jgi:hypothetical protein
MSVLALTLREAADAASIPQTILEARIVAGFGPKTRRIGQRAIILREDLEDWLRSQPETDLCDLRDPPAACSHIRNSGGSK